MTEQLAPPNNSTALAGLVLGIIAAAIAFASTFAGSLLTTAILLAALPALLAVIFGFVGLSTSNRLGGKRKRQAVWAIILGFTPWVFAFAGGFLRAALLGV